MEKHAKTDLKDLSFEDALTKLEEIVGKMEEGDTPLAELLAKFEEGNALIKTCEQRLKDAELKIELLKKKKGATESVPFELEPEPEGGHSEP